MSDAGTLPDLEPMPEDWSRALAIVAHPDDLEYGTAAAVAVWTSQGKDVRYVLVTRGEAGIDGMDPSECGPLRSDEQIAAAAVVGVDVVEFLDHPDGMIEAGPRLRADLAGAVRRHRPELLLTLNHRDQFGTAGGGGAWNMPDHRIVGRAVLDAAADAGNRWFFPEHGEPWSGVRWVAVGGSPLPTHAVDVTDGLERGIASLEAHAEYLRDLGEGGMADARGFLTHWAEDTATRFGGRLATAFELYSR